MRCPGYTGGGGAAPIHYDEYNENLHIYVKPTHNFLYGPYNYFSQPS